MGTLRALIIALISIVFVNCGGGGGGGVSSDGGQGLAPLAAKYQGNYFIDYSLTSKPGKYYHDEVIISGNQVAIISFVFASLSPGGGYYRVNKGTFTENGNTVTITYSKETCNPVGTETLEINGDQTNYLTVTQGEITVIYKNSNAFSSAFDPSAIVALVEDTNCNQF